MDNPAPPGSPPATATWSYWRPEPTAVLELCTVSGRGAGLPTHFHDEDQLTFVLSGRRRFILSGTTPIEVTAGQALVIPARTPHLSLPDSSDLLSFNAYLPKGHYNAPDIARDLRALWHQSGRLPWSDVLDVVIAHRHPDAPTHPAAANVRPNPPTRVHHLAATAGMTREAYSRKFQRHHGLPPHTYLLIRRLNQARNLLRAGTPIATTAANCGFADQSHLGRWFRRTFGTTPGRYQKP